MEAYTPRAARFLPYDPNVVLVAQQIAAVILQQMPELQIEHIGSTAVPGCGGKGIVDLAVLYPQGMLVRARQALDDLGFQPQVGREPFPETRPMRVGAWSLKGQQYRIHAHVIAADSDERTTLLYFRDRLRADSELVRRYEGWKRDILALGITDTTDYCKAKGAFIEQILAERPAR